MPPMATVAISLFDGAVSVFGYGVQPNNPNFNWSLKGISEKGVADPKLIFALWQILNSLNVTNAYAPHPIFSSNIATIAEFDNTWGYPFTNGNRIRRGVEADGVILTEVDTAFAMSSADCALVVIRFGMYVYVLHVGRDCLIDRNKITGGEPSKNKKFPSIIDSAIHNIKQKGGDPERIKVFIGLSISAGPHFAHSVDDQKHGEFNKAMLKEIGSMYPDGGASLGDDFWKHGHISLKDIIRQQFLKHGVLEEHIETDNICTYSDRKDGKPLWNSQCRTPGMRNLIVVKKKR